MVTEGFVEVSDGRLAWTRRAGRGPALVLSHGLTDNGACWSRLLDRLPPEFDVWMLDARGHGRSARFMPDCPFDPARDLAEAMDGLGISSALLMGHSVGAMASARLAAASPARARALILEDPPLRLPPGDAAARQAQITRRLQSLSAMAEADILAMGRAASPGWHPDEFPAWVLAKRQVDPAARLGPDHSWRETFAAIQAPTLLLHGEAALGAMVDDDDAADVVALNPRIRTLRIAGAGHNVRRENLPDFAAAVIAFLATAVPEPEAEVQDGRHDPRR